MNVPFLAKPCFQCEIAALERLEQIRWPSGPICHHCGSKGAHYKLWKSRPGLWKCAERSCRKQFSVKSGNMFHKKHIPINVIFQIVYLMWIHDDRVTVRYIQDRFKVNFRTATDYHCLIGGQVQSRLNQATDNLFYKKNERLYCVYSDEYLDRDEICFDFALNALLYAWMDPQS